MQILENMQPLSCTWLYLFAGANAVMHADVTAEVDTPRGKVITLKLVDNGAGIVIIGRASYIDS